MITLIQSAFESDLSRQILCVPLWLRVFSSQFVRRRCWSVDLLCVACWSETTKLSTPLAEEYFTQFTLCLQTLENDAPNYFMHCFRQACERFDLWKAGCARIIEYPVESCPMKRIIGIRDVKCVKRRQRRLGLTVAEEILIIFDFGCRHLRNGFERIRQMTKHISYAQRCHAILRLVCRGKVRARRVVEALCR